MSESITVEGRVAQTPVDDFSDCHMGILRGLQAFADLPLLKDAALRAMALADQTLKLFDEAVLEHHAQEEEELFPAVIRSARAGTERELAKALVVRLTEEHRELEDLWKRLRPEVKAVSEGRHAQMRQPAVDLLVEVYAAHARSEEREFLPLAQEILGRDDNHMAALGMSLHMRHVRVPSGYI